MALAQTLAGAQARGEAGAVLCIYSPVQSREAAPLLLGASKPKAATGAMAAMRLAPPRVAGREAPARQGGLLLSFIVSSPDQWRRARLTCLAATEAMAAMGTERAREAKALVLALRAQR